MSYIEVPSAVDERFRVRGPYWVPGDSVLVEPYVAVAECATGHLVVPCGRNIEHALATVARWEALQDDAGQLEFYPRVVGAAVVDPRGEILASWGSVPMPGGPPRWAPLKRLGAAESCGGCGARRWPGCWVTADLGGCAECQPAREAADPRPWPLEPPERAPEVARRKSPTVKKKTSRKAQADDDGAQADDLFGSWVESPNQGRLE